MTSAVSLESLRWYSLLCALLTAFRLSASAVLSLRGPSAHSALLCRCRASLLLLSSVSFACLASLQASHTGTQHKANNTWLIRAGPHGFIHLATAVHMNRVSLADKQLAIRGRTRVEPPLSQVSPSQPCWLTAHLFSASCQMQPARPVACS